MSFYKVCPHCGAHLDPGELCDCRAALEDEACRLLNLMTPEQVAKITTPYMKKTARGATNTTSGNQTPESH